MLINLSSLNVSALSATFSSEKFIFVNNDRNVNYSELSSYSNTLDLKYPSFTENIKDINFKNSYFTFLTEFTNLSSYINSVKTVSTLDIGYEMKQFNTKYDWEKNNFTLANTANNITQFLGIVDYSSNFNLLPLKTKISINNEPYSTTTNYRTYQKIYDLNDSIFLQFKVNKIPVLLEPDKYSLLFNSYDVSNSTIANAGFIENGALGGNCPLNSDVIFFEKNEYGKYTNVGTENKNTVNNGTLLCLWLSSQSTDPLSNKKWMERWYDPNTVTQGNAFITQKTSVSSEFSYIKDIPSTKILSEKEKFTYLRYGPQRNETFINSISSDLQTNFKYWSQNFSSETNNLSGFIVGDYLKSTDILNLDGTIHAHIPPEDPLFPQNNLTLSLWANADDWKINNDSQFFGNFHDETGYGIFYNTGVSNNLISIPTSADNIFALNNKGYKVFEKDLKADLGLSAIAINYIKTDVFGNRWLYDSYNHSLYKVENDDLVIKTVSLPSNSNITKMDCDSDNNLYILDTKYHQISCFNSDGVYLRRFATQPYQDNFAIDINDNIIKDSADFLTVNSKNQKIKIIGPTVYINSDRVLHLPDKPKSLRLDLYDNIWILFGAEIIKLDPEGNIIFKKHLNLTFSDTSGEMCFIKNDKNNKEQIQLWIIFNKGKYVIVLNEDGSIWKQIDLSQLFIGSYCGTFQLNIVGDFTGFDNKRKFDHLNGKPITPKNPTFTVRVGLKCGSSKKTIQLHSSTDYISGWTHFALSVYNGQNNTTVALYVNGRLEAKKVISGRYLINYSHRVSPFIIGGHSGKLGAKNIEKSIVNSGFFIGQIDDIRLYDRKLNDFEILNLSTNSHYTKWSPISFYIKSPPITLIEEIDSFHLNRYKGFKSNYFNIKIKNFTDDSDLKELVKTYIENNIYDFIPANTILNEIKFE